MGINGPLSGLFLGIFAPSGPFELDRFEKGLNVLTDLGIKFKVPKGIFNRYGYLAGTDEHRLGLLSSLMEDPEVGAVMAARGGYGAMRLLPELSGLWEKWPDKPIIGFSDVTALHLGRLAVSGVLGWHAPVVTSLGEALAVGITEFGKSLSGIRLKNWNFSKRNRIKNGQVQGPLIGGNLTVFASLLGTSYLPELSGSILMLEDVGEPGYRLDRLLMSLRLGQIFSKVSGVVFGSFTGCGKPDLIKRLIREFSVYCNGPVVDGATFGHVKKNMPWPMGGLARLLVGDSFGTLEFV